MPKVEIEVGDDGKIGTLPEPLQKFFDSKFDEAFGKGKAKAAEEAKGQGADPVTIEKLKAAELENSKLKEAEAIRSKNYEEAERLRNERHANELKERDEKLAATTAEVTRRTQRIEQLSRSEIRIAAIAAGARQESLGELEALLGTRIGLDDALQAFVRDAKDAGKPLLDKDQKPVSIEGFVTQYLTDHPHHKAAPGGRGGGAQGGRSFTTPPPSGADAEKANAIAEVERNPSVANVARAFSRIGAA